MQCDARGFPVETNPCEGGDCVEVISWNMDTLRQNNNLINVYVRITLIALKGSLFQYFSRKKSTAMVAWCKEVDARDIVEVSTEADFTECRNLPSSPVLLGTEGGLDGFLVRRGQRPRYFVSRDLCREGLKIKIDFDPTDYLRLRLDGPCRPGTCPCAAWPSPASPGAA